MESLQRKFEQELASFQKTQTGIFCRLFIIKYQIFYFL
jgi:hypothetical protein